MSTALIERDHVQSLERGLAVIRSFSREHPVQSVAEVARRAQISRAAARRLLLTLEKLDYVGQDGRGRFSLRPAVLALGYSYLASLELSEIARPYMERIVAQVEHSCSLCVLDRGDIVYIGRVPSRKMISSPLTVGSRWPAHLSSPGRVLLASLPDAELDRHLREVNLVKLTEYTHGDRDKLREEILKVRQLGYAIVREEIQYGVTGIAVAIRDRQGRTQAALSVALHDRLANEAALLEREYSLLREAAQSIGLALGGHGALAG